MANTSGSELGEVFYCDLKNSRDEIGPFEMTGVANQFDEIIKLGYSEPEVYALRAEAHFCDFNYGLALKDIDQAISLISDPFKLSECYHLRANILVRIAGQGNVDPAQTLRDAYDSFTKAYRLCKDVLYTYSFTGEIESQILYRIVLEYATEMQALHSQDIVILRSNERKNIHQALVRDLALWVGHLYRTHPKIAHEIREIVGEDFWQLNKSQLE